MNDSDRNANVPPLEPEGNHYRDKYANDRLSRSPRDSGRYSPYRERRSYRSPSRSRRHRRRSPSRSASPPRYRRSRRTRSRSYSRVRRSPPPRRPRDFNTNPRDAPKPSTVLGVFGLSLRTKERDLEELFGDFGSMKKVTIIYDHRTDRSRGFGFVYYNNVDDASAAKEKLNGMELHGKNMRVDFSLTSKPHSPTPGEYMGPKRSYRPRRRSPSYSPRYRRSPSRSPRRRRVSRSISRSRSRGRSYSR